MSSAKSHVTATDDNKVVANATKRLIQTQLTYENLHGISAHKRIQVSIPINVDDLSSITDVASLHQRTGLPIDTVSTLFHILTLFPARPTFAFQCLTRILHPDRLHAYARPSHNEYLKFDFISQETFKNMSIASILREPSLYQTTLALRCQVFDALASEPASKQPAPEPTITFANDHNSPHFTSTSPTFRAVSPAFGSSPPPLHGLSLSVDSQSTAISARNGPLSPFSTRSMQSPQSSTGMQSPGMPSHALTQLLLASTVTSINRAKNIGVGNGTGTVMSTTAPRLTLNAATHALTRTYTQQQPQTQPRTRARPLLSAVPQSASVPRPFSGKSSFSGSGSGIGRPSSSSMDSTTISSRRPPQGLLPPLQIAVTSPKTVTPVTFTPRVPALTVDDVEQGDTGAIVGQERTILYRDIVQDLDDPEGPGPNTRYFFSSACRNEASNAGVGTNTGAGSSPAGLASPRRGDTLDIDNMPLSPSNASPISFNMFNFRDNKDLRSPRTGARLHTGTPSFGGTRSHRRSSSVGFSSVYSDIDEIVKAPLPVNSSINSIRIGTGDVPIVSGATAVDTTVSSSAYDGHDNVYEFYRFNKSIKAAHSQDANAGILAPWTKKKSSDHHGVNPSGVSLYGCLTPWVDAEEDIYDPKLQPKEFNARANALLAQMRSRGTQEEINPDSAPSDTTATGSGTVSGTNTPSSPRPGMEGADKAMIMSSSALDELSARGPVIAGVQMYEKIDEDIARALDQLYLPRDESASVLESSVSAIVREANLLLPTVDMCVEDDDPIVEYSRRIRTRAQANTEAVCLFDYFTVKDDTSDKDTISPNKRHVWLPAPSDSPPCPWLSAQVAPGEARQVYLTLEMSSLSGSAMFSSSVSQGYQSALEGGEEAESDDISDAEARARVASPVEMVQEFYDAHKPSVDTFVVWVSRDGFRTTYVPITLKLHEGKWYVWGFEAIFDSMSVANIAKFHGRELSKALSGTT